MNEAQKKQVPLRLSNELYNELAGWAEEEFRSLNGQIEYLLTACLKQRRKNGAPAPKNPTPPFTVELPAKNVKEEEKHHAEN